MSETSYCVLRRTDGQSKSITLFDNKEVILGRNPTTEITDLRCSKRQVSVIADLQLQKLTVTQLGSNASGYNGLALTKNQPIVLCQNDHLELLSGQYCYKIEFFPGKQEKKLKREYFEEATPNKKICLFSSFSSNNLSESSWESIDNGQLLIFTGKGVQSSDKIASYDIDGTIITTKSGRVFPKDIDDWKIAYPEVPGKLKQLWQDGFKIVFFTNQAGIKKGKLKTEDFKMKMSKLTEKLRVPVQIFISTGDSIYRKPAPGMWNTLIKQKNDNVSVNVMQSFYCGDAAGRPDSWAPKKKKDFSCSDRCFALNLKLRFFTPEEHFLGHKQAPYKLPNFNPLSLSSDHPLLDPVDTKLHPDMQEIILLVGSPGSGKSHFAENYLTCNGYIHINRDTLGSWQQCIAILENSLKAGKSAVIDNTNPDKISRRKYIDIARKYNVLCRCFVLSTSIEHAKHNNKFRSLTDKKHEPISEVIINMYKAKYEEPSPNEGFSSIVKVNFNMKFDNDEKQILYKMFLLDK